MPGGETYAEEYLRFRTGAAMLSRLGSQQLKDEITAVMELVKNAYDADATEVRIELRVLDDEMTLSIQDNGSGMSIADLWSKWAWLATENKLAERRSPILRRPRLGQKGVGRFATEKLGRTLVLRTRTTGDSRVTLVTFNWDDLSADEELGNYTFPLRKKKPKPFEPPQGTTLKIRDLRIRWTQARVERLRQHLRRLIDPASATDFRIIFSTPWPELDGPLENPLLGNETHSLLFDLDPDGNERIELTFGDSPQILSAELEPPAFGSVRGHLKYFGKGLPRSERARGTNPDADWNVGVRIFRDGCRVRPYGEPGPDGDWLQIYRTRYLKGSRFRLKPHYLEGTIHITLDDNPDLRDTTGREGLEDNDASQDLTTYVRDKVAQLSELLREEDTREQRRKVQEGYKRALSPLSAALNELRSEQYKRAVSEADLEVRKRLQTPVVTSEIRNAHWECLDCGDAWKVPLELTPTICREHSVGRDGLPSRKAGCGSPDIRRKTNVPQDKTGTKDEFTDFDDMLSAAAAYVSGIQITPMIDWEMGEHDDEAEVRPERRELAINGRHPSFQAAEMLDGRQIAPGTDLDTLQAVGALTVHIVDAGSLAWGQWHYHRSGEKLDELLTRYAELKAACLQAVRDSATAVAGKAHQSK